jgi:methylmalonyl-CoA mutase
VAGLDLVIVETLGIGQGDSGVISYADILVHVMTPEFGSPSQLEKIDMLDFADAIAINKFERGGGEDALRDVRRQLGRNIEHHGIGSRRCRCLARSPLASPTMDSIALYQFLRPRLAVIGLQAVPTGRSRHG